MTETEWVTPEIRDTQFSAAMSCACACSGGAGAGAGDGDSPEQGF